MGQLAMKLISSILDEELKSGEGGGDAPTIMFVCGSKKKDLAETEGEDAEGTAKGKQVCPGCTLDSHCAKLQFQLGSIFGRCGCGNN